MTDLPKEKGKRVTFEWSEDETRALDIIATREPFSILGSSRRAIVRYVLLMYAKMGDEMLTPASKADIAELMSLMRGVAMVAKVGTGAVVESPRRTPKADKNAIILEEKEDAGINICEALGGTVSGKSCIFKKYEVMATGRPVSFDVAEPLASLTGAHLTQQFEPSREGYDQAVAGWKEGE